MEHYAINQVQKNIQASMAKIQGRTFLMGLNGNNFLKQIEKRLDFNSFTIIMWSVYLAVITNHISRIIKNERSKYRISKRMLQTIPFMIWIFIKNWYFRIYKVNLCCLEWWNQKFFAISQTCWYYTNDAWCWTKESCFPYVFYSVSNKVGVLSDFFHIFLWIM